MKKSTLILICLGVLAAIASAAPGLGMLPAITVIGLPIAVAYWALPALFLVYFISYLIYWFIPINGKAGAVGAVIIALILLAVPPFFINRTIEAIANSYVADDRDTLKRPISHDTIAVRQYSPWIRKKDTYTLCDGFCLHALLSGTASNVIIFQTRAPHAPLDPSVEGIQYSIEGRSTCPEVGFRSRRPDFKLDLKLERGEKAPNAIELMKLRMSDGACLVSKPAKLAGADLIISRGSSLKEEHKGSVRGFDLSASSLKVERFTVHTKQGATGDFAEEYRFSEVRYKPLLPILLPVPEFFAELRMEMGWGRIERSININDKYYQGQDWPGFVTETLGLDLRLENENLDGRVNEKIVAALEAGRKPTVQEWGLIEAYYENLFVGNRRDIKPVDYDNAIELLRMPEFPPIPNFHGVSKHVAKQRSADEVSALVGAMLTKLESGPTWDQALNYKFEKAIKDLGNSVRWLPDEAFLPFFERHSALASDKQIQWHSVPFVSKLHVHGQKSAPVLLDAMKTGLAGGEYFFRKNEFQHPYLGGLKGLCNGGSSVNSALPELLQMAQKGELPNHASYGDLLASTLIRMGAEQEAVWEIYSQWEPERRTRDRFDRLVRKAEGRRGDCSY